MVPDSSPAGLEAEELYVVVRKAIEDAFLSILGTLVLVGMAAVLVWFGTFVAIASGGTNLLQTAGGVLVAVVGLYFAGAALGVVPSLERVF